ncbi:ABC transporter substrate-binding protein [Roseateles sp. DAIF2]|uniref:ABC transporter substrate-binding protein n=1 Tax=Roseateles sp. DAIF2 TaxID=2714952 RepID=UPI0018A2AA92|nr:ABC transporter substrate-binding protein [Roseateles sp. DAIF2]QPF73986.1 ABC transporter substrate-binding protein [Roseateles sp. DAIF2]
MTTFTYRAVLAAMLVASGASFAAADRPVIGVTLPLSGPRAGAGQDALREINKKLAGLVVDVVSLDDADHPDVAQSNYRKLVNEKNVALVIGPLTSLGATAISNADLKRPVLALAQAPTVDMLKQAQQKSVFMFTQSPSQIAQLGKALSTSEKLLLTGQEIYAEKLSALSNVLGSRSTRGPDVTEENIGDVAKAARNTKATLVYIGAGSVAARALKQPRSSDSRLVFMSPPDPKLAASAAAAVVADWIKNKDLTEKGLRAALSRSPYFDAASSSLAMSWSVDTIGRKLLASASTSSSKCTCASKDGQVTHEIECKDPPDKCKTTEQETDCSCECKSK